MASKIHHIELITRLASGSQLFIPPLRFDRASVASAAHLVSLVRASGREAHLLAHPTWPQDLLAHWPREWLLLPEDTTYHIKNRPDNTWLWGLSNFRQHSQELRNFLLGLKSIQVLDWTAERRRSFGDYVHLSPHLGGLTELSFTLARELWPVHHWDPKFLGQALAAFFLRYPICCSDAPLVHMIQQLEPPVFASEPWPTVHEILRREAWVLHVYKDLGPEEMDFIRQNLLALFVRDRAKNVVVALQYPDKSWEFWNVHQDINDDLRCRNTIKKYCSRAIDGARFNVEDLSLLLDVIAAAPNKKVLSGVSAPIEAKIKEEELAQKETSEAMTSAEQQPSEDKPSESTESKALGSVETSAPNVSAKENKLTLEPWAIGYYLDRHFSFECSDPQWTTERDQRLEMMRDFVPEEDEDEEEEEEAQLRLEWDSSLLIRRLQALKLPPLVLTTSDLRWAHLPIVKLRQKDLKSHYIALLNAYEERQQQRLMAHLENLRLIEIQKRETQRLEAERQETQRLEAERLEAERQEAQRLEAERLETERQEAQRLEAERLEAERQETQRLEAERLEAERQEAQRLEAERLEAERQEAQRLEAERLEAERQETQRLEFERQEAQREKERLEDEQQEAQRLEAELGADYLHQDKDGWSTEEKLEDEELLEHLTQLDEQYQPRKNRNHYDDEEKLDDSEGIEHPSFDMFADEEEKILSAEELLDKLDDFAEILDDEEDSSLEKNDHSAYSESLLDINKNEPTESLDSEPNNSEDLQPPTDLSVSELQQLLQVHPSENPPLAALSESEDFNIFTDRPIAEPDDSQVAQLDVIPIETEQLIPLDLPTIDTAELEQLIPLDLPTIDTAELEQLIPLDLPTIDTAELVQLIPLDLPIATPRDLEDFNIYTDRLIAEPDDSHESQADAVSEHSQHSHIATDLPTTELNPWLNVTPIEDLPIAALGDSEDFNIYTDGNTAELDEWRGVELEASPKDSRLLDVDPSSLTAESTDLQTSSISTPITSEPDNSGADLPAADLFTELSSEQLMVTLKPETPTSDTPFEPAAASLAVREDTATIEPAELSSPVDKVSSTDETIHALEAHNPHLKQLLSEAHEPSLLWHNDFIFMAVLVTSLIWAILNDIPLV